jgi:hypothetical protein
MGLSSRASRSLAPAGLREVLSDRWGADERFLLFEYPYACAEDLRTRKSPNQAEVLREGLGSRNEGGWTSGSAVAPAGPCRPRVEPTRRARTMNQITGRAPLLISEGDGEVSREM